MRLLKKVCLFCEEKKKRERNKKIYSGLGLQYNTIQFGNSIFFFFVFFCYFIECEPFIPSENGCAAITASVQLQFQPEDTSDPDFVTEEYQTEAETAVDNGDLQEKLVTLYPDTPIYVIDSTVDRDLAGGGGSTSEGGIKSGGIAGIIIASVAFIGLFIAYFVSSRFRDESKEDLEPLDPAPQQIFSFEDPEVEVTLGAEPAPEHGKKKHESGDHDSDAGDSGWSSSAGVSSLGDQTGSTGGGLDNQTPTSSPSNNMAEMSAQQHQALRSAGAASPQSMGGVTRADLDSAIEAGDWAAVGATAALLAAASDTNSFSSRSITAGGTSTKEESTVSSYDAARAAELDHLVDAGDWEGVVLAAAKFEASSTVASDSDSRHSQSQSRGSASVASNSSPSKTRKQEEWRAEVEDLVQRVVPEEMQNVDEMMLQFRGREEELIETLRTMQERQIAQKARVGAQKAAKAEAKKSRKEKKSSFGVFGSSRSLGSGKVTTTQAPASGTSLGTGAVSKPPSSREKKQSTLEKAIESGDWEAVGEAAAMLNDGSSASSADTDEINRLAEGLSSAGSQTSGDSSNNRAARAEELDALIDQGDWMGVVQAAAEMESEDAKPSSKRFSLTKKKKEEAARREKRSKRLKEEQEALEQAEIWMAIAEKSKEEGKQQDKGASEAADWAIGRSLAALVEAEGTGQMRDSSHSAGSSSQEDQDDSIHEV